MELLIWNHDSNVQNRTKDIFFESVATDNLDMILLGTTKVQSKYLGTECRTGSSVIFLGTFEFRAFSLTVNFLCAKCMVDLIFDRCDPWHEFFLFGPYLVPCFCTGRHQPSKPASDRIWRDFRCNPNPNPNPNRGHNIPTVAYSEYFRVDTTQKQKDFSRFWGIPGASK
jgi:hypothetical protein